MKTQDTSATFWLEALKKSPTSPGIYFFQNITKEILYVGKAKNLKNRLQSYASSNQHPHPRTRLLLTEAHCVDWILTDTEAEALLLEATWIKKYRPKFNIQMKDDKAYPYLKLQLQKNTSAFPKIEWTRRVTRDGAYYWGPFPSGTEARSLLQFLNQTFQLRDCSDSVFHNRSRPCILYQIEQCSAPCVGKISETAYHAKLQQLIPLLDGKDPSLHTQLASQLQEAIRTERFEQAAQYRDQLQVLTKLTELQGLDQSTQPKDQDVFGIHSSEEMTQATLLCFRGGRLQSVQAWNIVNRSLDSSLSEILKELLTQHYASLIQKNEPSVREVLLPQVPEEINLLEKTFFLSIRTPETPLDEKLIAIAQKNAQDGLTRIPHLGAEKELLEKLQKKWKLFELPKRIECYDISNLQQEAPVASRVVFLYGKPQKNLYRQYHLHTPGPNDFAMMREVLLRRFKQLPPTGEELPQLILVDGGKGQLAQAMKVLDEKGLSDQINVLGLAKARSARHTEERIIHPDYPEPFILSEHEAIDCLLISLRNEAHRFALNAHRLKRAQGARYSPSKKI